MEINNFSLSALHNEEHFQFNKEFKELVEQIGTKQLNIDEDFKTFLQHFAGEEEALNLVRKSDITKQMEGADKERDILSDGLSDAVSFGLKHFNEEVRAAAARYKILLDQYGDIARKPYDDETAAIYKLVKESQSTFAADVALIGITDWIIELDKKNKAFESLKNSRSSKDAQKTELRMKTVRVEVDEAYRTIVKRINALILIDGLGNHEAFVRELNSRIDKINIQLAQRKGRSTKKNGKNNNPQEQGGEKTE